MSRVVLDSSVVVHHDRPRVFNPFGVIRQPEIHVSNETPMMAALGILLKRCPSWIPAFGTALSELQVISSTLDLDVAKMGQFVPDKNDLFRAFELTPLDRVRVVIVGQDPYHQILANGRPRAKGLSFSVDPTDEIPSSLKNIFKEIGTEYPEWTKPVNGDLTRWASQGILLLNSCLTCRPGQADSHSAYGLWMPFIIKMLNAIDSVRRNCIYVMWGAKAQKMGVHLGDKSHRLVAAHPSGLSASRGFFGCGHFAQINSILAAAGESPIVW